MKLQLKQRIARIKVECQLFINATSELPGMHKAEQSLLVAIEALESRGLESILNKIADTWEGKK